MHDDEKRRPHGVEAYAINRFGHAAGRKLAAGLWNKDWIRRMAAEQPELMKLASEGLIAVTSFFEMGGDHPIARLANFVAESMAMENLELLEKFEKSPDDPELAKQVEQKVAAAIGKADGQVIVALEHVHKDEHCAMVSQYVKDATPPSFGGKPGQPPRVNPTAARLYPMTLSAALAAHKPLCGLCYPSVSVRKPEETQEKPREVVPGRNFMEYVMRYKADNALNGKFLNFWTNYLIRLEGPDGPDLARKFQDAFDGRHSYEAFCFVAERPHRNDLGGEEWHHALDALLGKVTPPDSLKKKIEGFLEEEKRQTEEMFKAIFAWLERANAKRVEDIAASKKRIAELDEKWIESRKARKSGKTKRKLVFLGLLVVLASWFTIQRVTDAPARSETSEQKVENENER